MDGTSALQGTRTTSRGDTYSSVCSGLTEIHFSYGTEVVVPDKKSIKSSIKKLFEDHCFHCNYARHDMKSVIGFAPFRFDLRLDSIICLGKTGMIFCFECSRFDTTNSASSP